jgi:hypothetical protein
MNEMEDAFLEFLGEYGKDVIILHYTGTPEKNNAGDEIPVTPEEIQTKCRIIKKQAYESKQFGNVTVSGIYAVGMFVLNDLEYLKEGNKVVHGVTTYEIKYVEVLEGHHEAIMV